MWDNLKLIILVAGNKTYRQLFVLILILILAAMAEMLTVSTIIPLINVLISGPDANPLSNTFFLELSPEAIFIFFVLAILASGFLRIYGLYAQTKFGYSLCSNLGGIIFKKILDMAFIDFINTSIDKHVSAITTRVEMFQENVVLPLIYLVSSVFISVGILATLLYINFRITLLSIVIILSIYILLGLISKIKFENNSKIISNALDEIQDVVHSGLKSFKDINLSAHNGYYVQRYLNFSKLLRSAQASNVLYGIYPRYLIESLGLIVLVSITLFSNSASSTENLAVIAAIGLGFQRLLPLVQTIYASWVKLKGAEEVVSRAAVYLRFSKFKDPKPSSNLPFSKSISMDNVSFSYGETKVIDNITFNIPKGSVVWVKGRSGVGKSTFIDLLMGFLEPDTGAIRLDGTVINTESRMAYQAKFSYVPQEIHLFNASISENITLFSRNSNNNKLVLDGLKYTCCVDDLSDQTNDGNDLRLVRQNFSGGQKQRIGIARALYCDRDILIMDEATSALDPTTENTVLHNITSGKYSSLTVFLISHNPAVSKYCSHVIDFEKQPVTAIKI